MKKLIILLSLILIFTGTNLLAQAVDDLDLDLDLEGLGLEEEEEAFEFPEIGPEGTVFLGYRYPDYNGSRRAFEYEYLEDSPVFGGDLRMMRFPHRLYLDLDFRNEKDYFGEARYAYKDIVLFRFINNTFWHNLNNINLIDMDPTTVNPGVIIKDSGEEYGVRTGMNTMQFRLKKPYFPLHVYFKGTYVTKDGSQQQRSLSGGIVSDVTRGSGFYNDLKRVTQKRQSDQVTQKYAIGINSHLGPVEVDYAHTEKRFDVDDDKVLNDPYTAASVFRPEGTYPHNQLSELKSSSNKIKIHTDLTGEVVATASFAKKDRENRDSRASEDVTRATATLKWAPLTRLSFFVKYAHDDVDADNPNTASITNAVTGATTTYPLPVKDSINRKTDSVYITALYRPESKVRLKAKYIYQHIKRENADLWNLEESTNKNTISFTADVKIVKGLKMKANYTHMGIKDPSYNTEPDNSDKGYLQISWLPHHRVNLFARYGLTRDERDNLRFRELSTASNRDVKTDDFVASGTFLIRNDLSLTASYAYMQYKVTQDIVYNDLGGVAELTDTNVPYEDTAHVYSAALHYLPTDKLGVHGQITYTDTDGDFRPNNSDLTETVSVSSFSDHDVRETVVEITGDYEFRESWILDLKFKYADFNDALDNIYDSEEDGDGYIILAKVTKRW
jgi:opacity protein-like surface antigen